MSIEDEENGDNDESLKSKILKKSPKKMSEREREEEIFRKMEEEESKKMRIEITRSLKRKRVEEGSLSEGDSVSGLSITASPKRLKVSDIFGDTDEEASSPTHNELLDPEIEKIGELESVRLSRYRLEKLFKVIMSRWMYMPFFNDRIPGFFVRVNIGTKNNEPLYREKTFRMSYISNQPFQQKEFEKLREEYHKAGEPLPRFSEINEKIEDYHYCINYTLSDSDINKIVEEKNKYSETPQNYSILKKLLVNELELAKLSNNDIKISEITAKLIEVNKICAKNSEIHLKKLDRSKIMTDERRLHELNEREKLVQEEVTADKDKDDDPFTRRRTLPSQIQFINSLTLKSEAKEKIIQMRKNAFKTRTSHKLETVDKSESSNLHEDHSHSMNTLHDFDLDINIDV
ncbi:hypothetical protein MXB_275 [Myxobolus squamalis]|nr:hypothetical protein MXB_275 [Myxobolus squamalis]